MYKHILFLQVLNLYDNSLEMILLFVKWQENHIDFI